MLGKSIFFFFCLEIFFYYVKANKKIMKGRANLPYSFEIISLGSVFLSLEEAFQRLGLCFILLAHI